MDDVYINPVKHGLVKHVKDWTYQDDGHHYKVGRQPAKRIAP